MRTKINLDAPYSSDFKQGYINTNKEPRRVVLLVRKDGSKTSTSYARYLMSCYLKRYLKKDEHVDHIDNNKLNDTIDNLQILSPADNNKKNRHKRTYMTLVCPVCNNSFTKESRQVNHKIKNGNNPTCSRRCGGIKSRTCIGSVS